MSNLIGGQDTARILQQLLTGHRVATPAMGFSPLQGKVVSSTLSQCVVTIDKFSTKYTFTAIYEGRWYWNGTANVRVPAPPKGTPCLVAFPPNTPTVWITSFSGGYPPI